MTDESALLAAVLDRPRDDTPRLLYADWLDDHGDPARAEFIRVQVELAGLRSCCPICNPETGHRRDCSLGDRGDELRRRERELWPLVTPTFGLPADWLVDVHPRGTDRSAVVRRGFVEHITVPSLDVLFGGVCGRCGARCKGVRQTPGIAAAVFAAHPVARVEVADREPWQNENGSYSWWMMYEGTPEESPDVPEKIWRHLPKDDGGARYPTRAAALDALSDVIVAYGRELVGLNPIL